MNHERQIVDLIERANDNQPFCECGRHTTAVWRDGVVWLECASRLEPAEGRLRRALASLTTPVHTHEPIVDVPPVGAEASRGHGSLDRSMLASGVR
jgi:hypothetical protein